MICWSCQAANPTAAKFCFNCGSRLAAEPAPSVPTEAPCRVCATMLPLDARFCGNCGTPDPLALAGSPPAVPPPAVPPPLGGEAEDPPDDEDEATVLRTQLEEAPLIPAKPGLASRERSQTEPAQVASSRTLSERLGRGPVDESPGVYSKKGPSLRKAEAHGTSLPPPPPIAASRARPGETPGAPPPRKKADTARKLPRAGLPPRPQPGPGASPRPEPTAGPVPGVGARPGTVPGVGARPGTVPGVGARPGTVPGVGARPGPVPGVGARPGTTAGLGARPAAPGEAAPARPVVTRAVTPGGSAGAGAGAGPSSTRRAEPASARAPRTSADPHKAAFGSPRPSEAAALLATPEGWPDITDELAEVRFSTLQGFEPDEVAAEVMGLRRKYPGHPEVEALADELGVAGAEPPASDEASDEPVALPPGVPSASGAPKASPTDAELTPVDGPPPLGRYPATSTGIGAGFDPDPPSSSRRPGAPRSASLETSDELLDVDADEFDDLEPGPDESMADLTLVDNMGLELEHYGASGFEDSNELELAGGDDDLGPASAPDEPDFVDRTMMVRGLQPPAPFGGQAPPGPLEPRPPGAATPRPDERRATLPPGLEAVDERRRSTLAPGSTPGSTLGSFEDDEHSTTLPPGGFAIDPDEPPTLAGLAFDEEEPSTLSGLDFEGAEPTLVGMDFEGAELPTLADLVLDPLEDGPAFMPDEPTPRPGSERSATLVPELSDEPPASYAGLGGKPPPDSGMTAPDRDADTAAASGTFNVADLDLDDMPDLSGPPPELELHDELEIELDPDEVDPDAVTTDEGTVVARAPVPPAPYGQGDAPLPVRPVRLVMLGARGEAVAERMIAAGSYLDLGRQPGEPWGEDRRMAPLHARLFPAPGGVVIDDFGLPSGVYTQIFDTIAVEDGDELKVGQARLALQRSMGPGGSWGQLTLVRHDAPAPQTVVLARDEIILGREEGDITFPTDTFVSGDHCRFIREGHAVYLEDLGSSNGTYIRVRAGQCVAFGGLLLVGHTQFEVHPG